MKLIKGLTLSFSIGLVACGGSGGKGGDGAYPVETTHQSTVPSAVETTHQSTVPAVVETATQPIIPPVSNTDAQKESPAGSENKEPTILDELKNQQTDYSEGNSLIGKTLVIPKSGGKELIVNTLTSEHTDSLRELHIDGKVINIFPLGKDSKSISIEGKNKHHMAEQYGNTLVGIINETSEPVFYAFTKAINPTKNIPTDGIIHYQGIAIHGYDETGKDTSVNHFIDGKAEFLADFDRKVIQGVVSAYNNQFDTIHLEGNIKQNYFIGSKDNVYLEGGFFGNAASEVSGTYIRVDGSNSVIGTFAAEKVKE